MVRIKWRNLIDRTGAVGGVKSIKAFRYARGDVPARYPVPALAYYYSLDKAHHDLQYVMLCSDEFVDGVIAYNMPRFR